MTRKKRAPDVKDSLNLFRRLPPELKPRVKIFLSADIVGSTALKQSEKFPLGDPKERWALSGAAPHWLAPIADFYTEFARYWSIAWREANEDRDFGPPSEIPELWKANGDELIFCKDVRDRLDLCRVMFAWKEAIRKYISSKSIRRRLGIKASAWIAGFPVTNTEIVFRPDLSEAPYEGEVRLRALYNLSKWYFERQNGGKSGFVRDFIGPQIDIGFRLAAHATSRYMVVSLDIVYLLATASFPEDTTKGFQALELKYLGRRELKGALGGDSYPLFCMDLIGVLEGDGQFYREEDALLENRTRPSVEEVQRFCNKFYDVKATHMFRPFLIECQYNFTKLPDNYYSTLMLWKSKWEAEKKRTSSDDKADAIAPKGRENEGSSTYSIEAIERQLAAKPGA